MKEFKRVRHNHSSSKPIGSISSVFGTETDFLQEFACNGNIVEDDELGKVIQLQGDQRGKIYNFLVKNDVDQKTIKLHGF